MKTYFIILTIILAAFLFGRCTTKEFPDFKVTIVPESANSVKTINNMNAAAEVVGKRLNNSLGIPLEKMKFDVTENQILLNISKAETGKILSIKETITDYSRLEFWETFENTEILGALSKANNLLLTQNPLFGILKPRVTTQGKPLPSCMIGLAAGKDTALVNRYMNMPEIKALFPGELKLMWSMNPYKKDSSKTLYELHAIKVTTRDGKAPVDGSVIISAKAIKGKSESDVKIDLTMNSEGTGRWAGITRENINRCIAVVLNGYVRSYPRIMTEISGGKTEITGDFTFEEANDLVNILKSGQLPFALKIVNEQLK